MIDHLEVYYTYKLIKIVLGDTNAKIGKELIFVHTIGLENAHEESNDNGQRIIF